MTGKSWNLSVEKQDIIQIVILVGIALVIGVYLIATTVLIAKDGMQYIECAQSFSENPTNVIKQYGTVGYPFLILITHKFVTLFVSSSSVQGWIYSAQSVTLLCRLLALIPLYFIGKVLVGSKNSFWGILILSVLPDSAEYGSDALTEWPHLMFLTIGFLLLLLGARYRKNWMFGWAGIIAGLGYLVRSESCQLILYGSVWLIFNLIRPQNKMKRTKAAGALILLLAGFAVIAIPYMQSKGYVFPDQSMWKLPAFLSFSNDSYSPIINANMCLAGSSITGIIGDKTLITNMCETLLYYFVPALLIGCYYYFRKRSKSLEEIFFPAAFIILNIVMLCWQSSRFLSKRHTLALVVLTVFYIPIGLNTIACWLSKKGPKNNVNMQTNRQRWFFVLLVIGMAICLPKLLRPMRINKQGYLGTAKWLKENTNPEDIIAVPDRRIAFYAERIGVDTPEDEICENIEYLVEFVTDEMKRLNNPLLFNGVDTVVKTNLIMKGASSITVSAWVKPNVASQNSTIFSPRAWKNDFFSIRSKKNRWYACLRWGTPTSHYLASTTPYAAGNWYQITGVADIPNQTLHLYVNGTLSNSTSIDSGGVFDNDLRWYIGGTPTQYFNGTIDNVMISNKALQANEVEALYAGGVRINGLYDIANIISDNSILAYWRIDKETSMWIDEIGEAKEVVYETLVDERRKTGKKLVIYKM